MIPYTLFELRKSNNGPNIFFLIAFFINIFYKIVFFLVCNGYLCFSYDIMELLTRTEYSFSEIIDDEYIFFKPCRNLDCKFGRLFVILVMLFCGLITLSVISASRVMLALIRLWKWVIILFNKQYSFFSRSPVFDWGSVGSYRCNQLLKYGSLDTGILRGVEGGRNQSEEGYSGGCSVDWVYTT